MIHEQAETVRAMKNSTPMERMVLAERFTELRMRADTLWLTMLGLGLKVVTAPNGAMKSFGYVMETGEPIFGTLEAKPFQDVQGEADAKRD